MSFVEIFIVVVIVAVLCWYIHSFVNSEMEYVKSRVDGRSYLVLSLPDKQQAADYLAEINGDVVALIKHLKAKYPGNAEYDALYQHYYPDKISEGSPDSNYTSYTINKSAMVICIRQNDEHKTFVDKNVLMYVIIHELVHMKNRTDIGHTPKFWTDFKDMLNDAIEMGAYRKVDYKTNPAPYCGITLSSSVV